MEAHANQFKRLIIKDNKVLTIFRKKNGVIPEFYVIPGGGQEKGETLEDIIKRELMEKMNVAIEILEYLGNYEDFMGQAIFFASK